MTDFDRQREVVDRITRRTFDSNEREEPDVSGLIKEARDYLDRECNVSQFPNLVSRLADALEASASTLNDMRGALEAGRVVVNGDTQ